MASQWHYQVEGREHGPVSSQELKRLARSGSLERHSRIKRAGSGEWVPAGNVQGLFAGGRVEASELSGGETGEEANSSDGFDFPSVLWRHPVLLVQYLGALRRRKSFSQAISDAQLAVGEDMYRRGLGDEQLREKIAAVDERIANVSGGGGDVKLLQAERRGMLIRLASQDEEAMNGLEADARLQEIRTRHDENEQRISRLRSAAWPASTAARGKLAAGYAALIALVVLLPAALYQFAVADYDSAVADFYAYEHEDAYETFLDLAEEGDPKAAYFLGVMAHEGLHVEEDEEAAAEWFEQAHSGLRRLAETGNPVAMTQLAEMYREYDVDPPEDADELTDPEELYSEASEGLVELADQDDPFAQFHLGLMYLEGRGVDEDEEEGIRWLERSAEEGSVEAMALLGAYHFDPDPGDENGDQPDFDQAVYWLTRAADRGQKQAVFLLPLALLAKGGGSDAWDDLGLITPEVPTEFWRRSRIAARQELLARAMFLESQSVPLIPGEWSRVTDEEEQQQLQQRLNRELSRDRFLSGSYPELEGTARVRWTELSCYEDARLYEVAPDGWFSAWEEVCTMIVSGDDAMLLDGAPPFAAFNNRHRPHLNSESRVGEYLTLYLRGHGTILAYEPYVVPWHWEAAEETVQRIEGEFQSITAEQSSDGSWTVAATVCKGTNVGRARYRVQPNGEVDQLELTVIGEDLPLLIEEYQEGRRVLTDPTAGERDAGGSRLGGDRVE